MLIITGSLLLFTLLDMACSQTCGDLGTNVSIAIQSPSGIDLVGSTTGVLGNAITMMCYVIPTPAIYQWLRNGVPLSQTGRVLRLDSIRGSDGGSYSCSATLSSPACMTRQSAAFTIQTPPDVVVSSPSKISLRVQEGLPFTVQCEASGWPIPILQWRRDEGQVVSTSGVYNVPAASLSDAGAYLCEAVNSLGNVTQIRVITIFRINGTTELEATEGGALPGGQSNETADQTGFYIGVAVAAGVSVGATLLTVTMCIICLCMNRPPPSAHNPYEDWPDGKEQESAAQPEVVVVDPYTLEEALSAPPPVNGEPAQLYQEDAAETIPGIMSSKSEIGEMF